MADIIRGFKEIITMKEPWNTKRGLIVWFFGILIYSLLVSITVTSFLFMIKFDLPLFEIFILILFSPVTLYLVFFLLHRSWMTVRFSKRFNIVLGYNLESVENIEKFIRKYNKFVKSLKNKINYHNFGYRIKLISRPADTSFRDNNVAELKTKLALEGATLVIWGYVIKSKRRLSFKTKFSYEFGRPYNFSADQAKKIFSKNIDKALKGGLFGLGDYKFDIDGEIFGNNTLSTSLFILGCTATSYGDAKKTIFLLEGFKDLYGDADLMRKRDMGPALVKTNEILLSAYVYLSIKCFKNSRKETEFLKYTRKALEIDPNDYRVNIMLAYYNEGKNIRNQAIFHNNRAANNSIEGIHDHIFNRAYFALTDGFYENAINLYKSIPIETKSNIVSIQGYFYDKFQGTKNPIFLFGEGYIVHRWRDVIDVKKQGKKILREFIKRASGDKNKFDVLLKEAQSILSE